MLRRYFFFNRKKRTGFLVLLTSILLLGFEIVDIGKAENSNVAQLQDCKTTASSVGLDIVLPIQAGGEKFQTGAWVYGPGPEGSDHIKQDLCALDFKEVKGKWVVAVADGVIEKAGWYDPKDYSSAYGYYVYMRHDLNGKKYYSLYAHLIDPNTTSDFPDECKVRPGMEKKIGECIGVSGATGRGGAHLHFSMFYGEIVIGPHAPNGGMPLAPEDSRGLMLYRTLTPEKEVTTMATATIDNRILPSLTLKLNEVQQRNFVFTNTSKIDWDQKNKFELVRISGTSLGTPEKVALTHTVKPGELATITLNITGTTPGFFVSDWQLHHNGVAFGPIVYLRYAVGVNVNDISDLPQNLWGLIKPMIAHWLENLISQYIKQFLQNLLNNIYQLCGIVPLGTIGILFGAVLAKPKYSSWKPRWSGQGSWLSVIQTVVGIGIIFLLSALLLVVGRELIWWSGVIKNTGIIVLVLSGLLTLWGVIRFVKWISDIGFKRLIVLLLIILIPITFFHGQRYRIDEPITTRYFYSFSDLTLISKDYLKDYWKESREFINELVVLLEE